MKHIDFTIDSSGAVKYDTNGLVVQGENNVTRLTVAFPLEYEQFSKYIVFHTKRGVLTEEGMVKNIEVRLSGSYFDLPLGFINAGIEEIAFRAVDDVGTVFATVKTAFPPVNEALLPDSSAAAEVILTGTNFEAGESIEITKKQVDFSEIIKIGLKRPLQNPIEVTEINGLEQAVSDGVNSKIEELLSQPNGLAGLDENGQISQNALPSNIIRNFTVHTAGISEIEFTGLDLSIFKGSYEVVFDVGVQNMSNYLVFTFNSLAIVAYDALYKDFLSDEIVKDQVVDECFRPASDDYFITTNRGMGNIKLTKIRDKIFLEANYYNYNSDEKIGSYTCVGYISAENITSIKAFWLAGEENFEIGSQIYIREVM